MSTDERILLHQYDTSPFSEKVRIAFGIKGLDWYAVDQPVIMPKPDLTCLTGGYRRIPVMQIGADVYCDSQLILRELERRFPDPSLLAGRDRGLSFGLGFWSDRPMFQAAVAIIFGGVGDAVDEAFKKDREALMGRPFDTNALKQAAPLMAEQLRAHCAILADQLGDGRRFLAGDAPGLLDIHGYYNLWFVRSFFPAGAGPIDGLPDVVAWESRVRELGHGRRQDLPAAEAVAIAKRCEATTRPASDPHEPNGLKAGDRVRVLADDYGQDPVEGELVASSAHEIALRRSDPRTGDVVVHFPRAGFLVMRA